jgi:Ubiquitin C-terminal hydrolase
MNGHEQLQLLKFENERLKGLYREAVEAMKRITKDHPLAEVDDPYCPGCHALKLIAKSAEVLGDKEGAGK